MCSGRWRLSCASSRTKTLGRYVYHSNLFRLSLSFHDSSAFLLKSKTVTCLNVSSLAILDESLRYIANDFRMNRGVGGCRGEKSKANYEVRLHQELGIEDQDPPDYLVGLGATPLPEWESTRLIICEIADAKKAVGPDGPFHLTLHGPCDLCPLPGGAVCEPRELGKPLWEL